MIWQRYQGLLARSIPNYPNGKRNNVVNFLSQTDVDIMEEIKNISGYAKLEV